MDLTGALFLSQWIHQSQVFQERLWNHILSADRLYDVAYLFGSKWMSHKVSSMDAVSRQLDSNAVFTHYCK